MRNLKPFLLAMLLAVTTGCGDENTLPEGTYESECSDGIDNDGDGLVDCREPDCAYATACFSEGPCSATVTNLDVPATTATQDSCDSSDVCVCSDDAHSCSNIGTCEAASGTRYAIRFRAAYIPPTRSDGAAWDVGSGPDLMTYYMVNGVRRDIQTQPLFDFTAGATWECTGGCTTSTRLNVGDSFSLHVEDDDDGTGEHIVACQPAAGGTISNTWLRERSFYCMDPDTGAWLQALIYPVTF